MFYILNLKDVLRVKHDTIVFRIELRAVFTNLTILDRCVIPYDLL